jgi:DNA-directed RNA polymerase specialized sigma subunit
MDRDKRLKIVSAKNILEEYREIDGKIKSIDAQIGYLEAEKEIAVTSVDYGKDRVSKTNKFSSETEDKAINDINTQMSVIEEIHILQRDIRHLKTLRRKTEDIIEAIQDEISKGILKLRYIEGRPWEEIADNLKMDAKHCSYYAHNKALLKFDEYWNILERVRFGN